MIIKENKYRKDLLRLQLKSCAALRFDEGIGLFVSMGGMSLSNEGCPQPCGQLAVPLAIR
jgi:hypothetical protein